MLPALLLGCTSVAPAGQADDGSQEVELLVTGWDGRSTAANAIPRRPRISVRAPGRIGPNADALLLFQDVVSSELISDLGQSPLNAEHRALLVPSNVVAERDTATLWPQAALAPHAAWTLAVPAWANAVSGTRAPKVAPLVFQLRTAAGPDAGASVVSSWPPDGATDIAPNLEAAVIAFDGTIHAATTGVWLEDPDQFAVPAATAAGPCQGLAPEHGAGFCVRLAPSVSLRPSARYTLVVGTEALDAHGAPLGPWRASFRTADEVDTTPPSLVPLACAVDETELEAGCALIEDTSIELRVQSDEPAAWSLTADGRSAFGLSANDEATLRLTSLTPDTELALELAARDAAGNVASFPIALRTAPTLAALSITEVRADAIGPEPQQELVEVLNYGDSPIELHGFRLDTHADALGTAFARSLALAPHTRALLVADDFDPLDARDPAPPPGTPLLRVGRALGGSGLSNAGANLYLRDAGGRRVSAAPPSPRPRPGVCIVRTTEDPRSGSAGDFDYDSHDTCTPGR